jgi:8-oxo-dGTP pyrophosphatase MutT (NUDIX family)
VTTPLARTLAALLDDISAVPLPATSSQPVPAAVLVALDAPRELRDPAHELAQLRVVLIKRRPSLRRHAGEIAFPGGRLEDSDRSLYDAALREVEEEIGLSPQEVTALGALGAVPTIATNYLIYPFVALVELAARGTGASTGTPAEQAVARWRTSAHEVEEVLELSLGEIDAGRGRTQLERRGLRFQTDTFTVGEHLIWGATFRIIDDLIARIRRGD